MDELRLAGKFVRAIQECMINKDLTQAKHIHEVICSNHMETHQDIGNHIVPMFVECGSLCDAQQVFDKLIYRNVYSWTYLMQGYLQCGQPEHTLTLYAKMATNMVQPSSHTFVVLLKACAQLQDLPRGQVFYGEAVQRGFEQDVFLGSTLIDIYSKGGSLSEAHDLFNKLGVQDVVAWNALIGGYTEHGEGHKALELVESMRYKRASPNTITFSCVLKACSSLRAITKGQELHEDIVSKGFDSELFVRTGLIDMYVKCGVLVDAHYVLDKLSSRNVVLWNALIAGYTEHGRGQEVLRCVEEMQLEGVVHDDVTLMCILKACNDMEALEKGRETHAEIIKRGYESHNSTGSTLLDFYVKCGSFSEAWEVFKKLPARNSIAWNVLLLRYGEYLREEETSKYFHKMQQEGAIPTTLTFVGILKSYGLMGTMSKGLEMHTEVLKRGFEQDLTVSNTLVDMYGKCGALLESEKVFSDIVQHHRMVSWNVLLSSYAEHGLSLEAINLYKRMRTQHVQQDEFTFASVLKACSHMGSIDEGYEIHDEILKRGIENDCFVRGMLVDMYAKCGAVQEARVLFDGIASQTNSSSWNALMSGLTEHGLGEEAWEGFMQMHSLGLFTTTVSYICALKACSIMADVDKGHELFIEIVKKGYDEDPAVGIALVDMYSKCGSLVDAQACVEGFFLEGNIMSWNSLILGNAEHGLAKEAWTCYKEMQLKGIVQDALTFLSVLRACNVLEAVDATAKGQEVHVEATLRGLETDPSIASALVDVYAKSGSFAEAKKVLEASPAQSPVPWNALIMGLTENALLQEVGSSYEAMQEQGISPNVVTYICLVKACGTELGAVERGWNLHVEIVCKGLEIDPHVSSTLVDMYAKVGCLSEALAMFNRLPIKNNIAWNAMLKGFGLNNESDTALQFYETMRAQGHMPDSVTFTCLLTACSRANKMLKGEPLFEMMRSNYSIMPNVDHLISLVDLLGRSGQLIEANQYLDSIPSSPSKRMWAALMSSCKAYQGKGQGSRFFHNIF